MSNIILVKVLTTNNDTGEIESKNIDHNSYDDRKWLGKHCYWAVRNNRTVTTIPIKV